MYTVSVQVNDENGAKVFSVSTEADRERLINEGHTTPSLDNVIAVLTETVEA